MKHKLILLTFITASLFMAQAKGQQTLEQNKQYNGATAKKKIYKAIYHQKLLVIFFAKIGARWF